jgi:hypothetical protein
VYYDEGQFSPRDSSTLRARELFRDGRHRRASPALQSVALRRREQELRRMLAPS